jgi:hypothetical protein
VAVPGSDLRLGTAMRWINGRLAIRGFEEPFDLEANAVLPRGPEANLRPTTARRTSRH